MTRTYTSSILVFRGQYAFLSNFYIEPDGTHIEGEYQQAKCAAPADRVRFYGLAPGQAKRLGRNVRLREDWEDVKLNVMYDLLLKKFQDHPALAERLRATRPAELVEGNSWGDSFWGVTDWGRGNGENALGRLLMLVRGLL
jgi:ribA/ribD-fused uncharacterized protein